jgi:hypothetical protein
MRLKDLCHGYGSLVWRPPGIGLAIKLLLPPGRFWMSTRTSAVLLVTFLLGPGLLANLVMKDHWARSRPIDVVNRRRSRKLGDANLTLVAQPGWFGIQAPRTEPQNQTIWLGPGLAFLEI